MNTQIIILLGVPGSGKGTQAKKLKDDFGFAHISSGDLLRALASDENANPILKEKLAAMKAGKLVANDLIYTLVFGEIEKQIASGKNVVLDGAIRNVEQAQKFDEFFAEKELSESVVVVEFTMPDELSLMRLTKRKNCSVCGHIIAYSPDNDAKTVCEKCGGALVVRTDDTPEIALKRIAEQGNAVVAPVREYYVEKGNYIEVDAVQDIDGMEKDLVEALGLVR